ncbi:MAG: hypothetical protein ACKVQR_22570 [Aquabacterium sp.]
MTQRRQTARTGRPALAGVLLLHAAALVFMLQASVPRRLPTLPEAAPLVWLRPLAETKPPLPAARPSPTPRPPPAQPARPTLAPTTKSPLPAPTPNAPTAAVSPPDGAAPVAPSMPHTPATQAAPPAATPASGTQPIRRLLDAPGTQRVIRDAARQTSVGEHAAARTDEPRGLTPDERLGREVAKGAKGDCLKGEYAGGGMGILSLPFWLAAEVSGNCRR